MKKDNWIYKVFLMTFFLSLAFSFVSNVISSNANLCVMILITILVIAFIFDMIGTASLTSNEATFHAKSSKKIKGAKESLKIIKNSVKVASICNDVIGDICGIISGGMGAMVALSLSNVIGNKVLASILVSSIISSLTVGGKAICKTIAIKKCDDIVFIVGKIKSIF